MILTSTPRFAASVNAEIMLYMAFVALANSSQASFEMTYAVKFMRILLVLLTALLDVWGFAGGVVLVTAAIAGNRTVGGRSYLYPLVPFDGAALKKRLLRVRIAHKHGDNR